MEGAIVSVRRVNYDMAYDEEGVCTLNAMEENPQLLWIKRKLGDSMFICTDLLNSHYVDGSGLTVNLVAGDAQVVDCEDDPAHRNQHYSFAQMEVEGVMFAGSFSDLDLQTFPHCSYEYFPSVEAAKAFLYRHPEDVQKNMTYAGAMNILRENKPTGPTNIDFPTEAPILGKGIFTPPTDSTDGQEYKWQVKEGNNPGLWNPNRIGKLEIEDGNQED